VTWVTIFRDLRGDIFMATEYDDGLFPLGCSWVYPRGKKIRKILKVMVIMAHMDDPDLLTGGLAVKLAGTRYDLYPSLIATWGMLNWGR
jgi:hypothetical protein